MSIALSIYTPTTLPSMKAHQLSQQLNPEHHPLPKKILTIQDFQSQLLESRHDHLKSQFETFTKQTADSLQFQVLSKMLSDED
jgi:hypothetical protein